MKKLLFFAFAVFAFVACTQNDVEELSANRADVPETLTVGFEGGDDTRIQLNEAQKTVWTKDDLVSVFYRSNANQKWQYQGETGERVGNLRRVSDATATETMHRTVVVYPYNENYYINPETYNIDAMLPTVQHYAEESYGVGDNLMVSQSEFTQFSLKNVCGWLKIQLTGNGERVQRLTLRGNNEEQLAGLIYVDTATAESTLASKMGSSDDNNAGGNLVFDDTIVTELTLDCGKGVELGEEAKSFYIAVPPQTFEKGFTVDVKCDNGTSTTKSTSEPITIERNHIQPMEAIEYDGVLPKVYELAYRTNDGNPLAPITTEGFGGEFEENIFDAATGKGKLVFAGAITTIPDNAFGCKNLTWIDIPKGITTIGASAFSSCSSMEELTIPDSVTTIGANAFWGCSSLTSVTIPDSVTTIGISAFRECYSLTSVTIGDSVTTIGANAFNGCISLTSVTIGDSVTTIGRFAFSSCGLTSVTIPDSVTTIGGSAFRYCNRLTSVTIGDSVTTIGDYAFQQCDSLTSVYCEATTPPSLDGNSVFFDNASGRKIYVPAESLEAYKAANNWSNHASSIVGYDFSITSIINYTTYDGQIVNARLPIISNTYSNGIGTIEFLGSIIPERAFCDCDSLTSVTIPDSITTIGVFAFADCDSLTEFNGKFAFEDGRCWIVDGTLNSFAPAGLTSCTIPDSVTTIGEGAFAYYSCLTSITIPDSVTTIEKYAFEYCKSLTSVTIGDSVTTIGERAFYDCDSLTSVTIPDSVTTIGVYAFYDCNILTSVIIGDSVTTIGEWAFYNCDSLTSVIIGDSVTTIGTRAFYDCDSLTSITIPDSVTTIGWHAFGECDSLTSVTIPDSVTTIGDDAFWYCYSLINVYCEATTPPSLGGNGFDVNASGRKIYVPAESLEAYKAAKIWSKYADAIVGYDFSTTSIINYTTSDDQIINTHLPIISNTYSNGIGTIEFLGSIIPVKAFYYCDSLTSVTIPDSVTTIGGYAFEGCDSLTEFNGKFAFEDGRCLIVDGTLNSFAPAGLTSYTIPDSVTTIGDGAFGHCDNLTSITIPDSVTTIEFAAFNHCDSLTSITIPDSVTTIGSFAFYDCYSLTSVYCEATTPPSLVGDNVFDNNASGRKIYIPAASVEAYKSATYWSEYKSAIVGYDFE